MKKRFFNRLKSLTKKIIKAAYKFDYIAPLNANQVMMLSERKIEE